MATILVMDAFIGFELRKNPTKNHRIFVNFLDGALRTMGMYLEGCEYVPLKDKVTRDKNYAEADTIVKEMMLYDKPITQTPGNHITMPIVIMDWISKHYNVLVISSMHILTQVFERVSSSSVSPLHILYHTNNAYPLNNYHLPGVNVDDLILSLPKKGELVNYPWLMTTNEGWEGEEMIYVHPWLSDDDNNISWEDFPLFTNIPFCEEEAIMS